MKKSVNTVFVSGVFNVLHIGHIRLFSFAKTIGARLVIGVLDEHLCAVQPSQSLEERITQLSTCSLVDEIIVIENSVLQTIREIRPNVILKGAEFASLVNEEAEFITEYPTCELLFSPGVLGDISHNGTNLAKSAEYLKRHTIDIDEIQKIINKFEELKVVVIGDSIVDEYVECEPIGMSREDPTIVVRPMNCHSYIGGAAIVAAHARALGASVKFISMCGNDQAGKFLSKELSKFKVEHHLFNQKYRPTTLKKRYRANGKTLLRVSELDDRDMENSHHSSFLQKVRESVTDADLVVLSDFSYGVLSYETVNKIREVCDRIDVPIIADAQSSSQLGDITKYSNSLLITPTEREARLAFKDRKLGLTALCNQIMDDLNIENMFITLGEKGIFIQTKNSENEWKTDEIEALNKAAVDPAGCGDSVLITAGLALVSGANIWEAGYLGSIAAAIQVSRKGNIPISSLDVKNMLAEV